MPQKELDSFTIIKKISDLRLKEEVQEVYCYMDCNKQTFEPMYNDELKLPVNIIKMVQKKYGASGKKMPTNKVFSVIGDVKIEYNKEKDPDNISFHIWMNI